MPTDIPYSELKKDRRGYEIMQMHDQDGNSFADIAQKKGMHVTRAAQIYNRQKIMQMRLYINHIAVALGHKDISEIKKVYDAAYKCYQDRIYACAYLEKIYNDILTDYREGEPGMPAQFVKTMPPFKPEISEKTIAQVIEMREVKKATFNAIAKELDMTQAKAKHTYEWFYHQQVMELIEALQEKVETKEEKSDILGYYFSEYRTSKKRYDALMKNKF